ncbi:MAG: PQQ-binding-like beta-propeller repeat protein [Gemmatimonadota bacterium]
MSALIPIATPLTSGALLLALLLSRPTKADGQASVTPKAGAPVDLSQRPGIATPSQRDLRAPADADWPTATRDYAGTRYSPLAQVTAANAPTLRAVCVYQFGETGKFQTTPVVHDGTLFVTTPRVTVALDAATCRPRWKHTWAPLASEVWPTNRGVAIKDGRVVRGTTDGHLIALDAATGALRWSVRAADTRIGETFTMSPLIFEGLILIGPAGSANNIAGWVGAFRLDDGQRVWRYDVIPDRSTWKGVDSIPTGGGATWTPFTLDTVTATLHVATSNPAPSFVGDVREGANLNSNSVVALDVRTGAVRWAKQLVPHDTHDWDVTHAGPLFTLLRGSDTRSMLAATGKDGLLRAIDRGTQAVLWETAITRRENVEAPITTTGVRTCPGMSGGVLWSGPAYSARTGLLYVNAVDWCSTFTRAKEIRLVPGTFYHGGTAPMDERSQWGGWLTAVDAATGAIRWRYRSSAPLVAGLAVTAGDVVFTGELGGDVMALDARTGDVRWRFNTGGPVGGGVATYAVAGTQYVAFASGRPSAQFVTDHPGASTLFVFALPSR